MNDFISIEILSTMTGCSLMITLLTQIFKKYLPEKIDTKWLALAFSVIIGVLRIIYIGQGQLDFNSIVSGVFNIFILLASSIGVYEIASPVAKDMKAMIYNVNDKNKGGGN